MSAIQCLVWVILITALLNNSAREHSEIKTDFRTFPRVDIFFFYLKKKYFMLETKPRENIAAHPNHKISFCQRVGFQILSVNYASSNIL